MKTNRKAAVLALGLALLPFLAGARTIDTEWWTVDFTSPTPEGTNAQDAEVGGVELFDGDSVSVLTNTVVSTVSGVTYKPAYASGFWYMKDGDESVITNGVVTNALEGTSGESLHIKLDTQGNDLTWQPSNAVPNVVNLVDADLLLVGSDSAPDPSDFDVTNEVESCHVQTAIYLKNEIDETSGETTNSILCVYAYNTGAGQEEWMDLVDATGTLDLKDNTWHHVRVSIDYTVGNPTVLVYVDGKPMTLPSGATITAANTDEAKTASAVRKVCFRGTGELDNFVGKVQVAENRDLWYEAMVYINDVPQPFAEGSQTGNLSRRTPTAVSEGSTTASGLKGYQFQNFDLSNVSSANASNPLYTLRRIELTNFVEQTSIVLNYTWDESSQQIVEETPNERVTIPTNVRTGKQTGKLHLAVFTQDAGQLTNVAAKLYFKTYGLFSVFGETYVDGTAEASREQRFDHVKASLAPGAADPIEFPTSFTTNGTTYILTRIPTNANPAVSVPEFSADGSKVVVTVSLDDLANDLVAAKAYYEEGSYGDKRVVMNEPNADGEYTFFGAVAMIDGAEPQYFDSLRQAIEEADPGDTVVLLADDRVSFSPTATEIGITKTLTIDGGSNTLYGVSDYAPPANGSADHDIYIGGSGNVTIKNLTLSEFSDTVPTAQRRTNPIWVGKGYTGTLMLDGVTVTNFNRTAFNLGGGTVVVTNCVVGGCYDPEMEGDDCFQSAIEVFDANVTVAETKVTGVGSTMTKEDSQIASCFTLISDIASDPWTGGTGSIRILSGSYAGEYIGLAMDRSEGSILVEGGTFVAAAPEDDEAFGLSGDDPVASVTITGGWFDRPPTNFIAAGLSARKLKDDSDPAPWTVGQVFEITFWTGDELDGAPAYWATNAFTGETGYGPAADPTKAASDGATYAFAGWTNELAGGAAVATADLPAVDGAASWLAAWTETAKSFDVTFMNGEAQFATTNVAYGTTEYAPTGTPAKAATAQFTYAFAGWSDTAGGEALASLPAVTNDATFYAAFTATTNEYTITWTMDDDSVIDTTTVAYGTVPTHADPTKAETAQYAYTFNGWDPEPVAVTGEATYKATFLPVLRSYDVTFWTGDEPIGGEAFWATNVLFGATGYGPTNDPVKAATSVTNFAFAGWTNAVAGGETVATADLPAVGGDATWTAVWAETPIWRVDFYAGEDGGTVCYTTNVLDGTELDRPADADLDPTPSKAATASHSFAFVGWTDEIGGEQLRWACEITSNTAFYPVFESNLVGYAIAFSTNGAVYATTNAPYGTTDYGPADPAWEGHAFAGWTNAVSGAFVAQGTAVFPAVAGEAEWTAVWTEDAQAPEVNAGQGLDTYVPEAGETVPPAIDFVAGAAAGDPDRCAVSFVAPATGWYLLMACDHVSADDADYQPDYGSKVEVTAATVLKPVTLVETSNATVKFFKIGWSKTEPVQP